MNFNSHTYDIYHTFLYDAVSYEGISRQRVDTYTANVQSESLITAFAFTVHPPHVHSIQIYLIYMLLS